MTLQRDDTFSSRAAMALAALVLSAAGCMPLGSVQTASTVGEGNVELGVEPGLWGAAASGGFVAIPRVDVAVRYGLDDATDIGVRFGSTALELQGKFCLTNEDSSGPITSFAPALMGFYAGSNDTGGGYLHLALPLLLGFGDPEGTEIVIGPRIHTFYGFGRSEGSSAGGLVLAAGSSFAAAFRVGKRFRFLPEVTLLYPFLGASDTSSDEGRSSAMAFGSKGLLFQGTLGFLFDF